LPCCFTVDVVGQGQVMTLGALAPLSSTEEASPVCDGKCRYRVPEYHSVYLYATPASGWAFSGWSGSITGSNPETSIWISGYPGVTATFVPTAVDGGIVDASPVEAGPDASGCSGMDLHTIHDVATGLAVPGWLAADENQTLYWTDVGLGPPPMATTAFRVMSSGALTNSGATPVLIADQTTDSRMQQPAALAARGGAAYWANQDVYIFSMAPGNLKPQVVVDDANVQGLRALFVDANGVFAAWLGAVGIPDANMKLSPIYTTINPTSTNITALIGDANDLYFPDGAELVKAPRAGNAPTLLRDDGGGTIVTIALYKTTVYWDQRAFAGRAGRHGWHQLQGRVLRAFEHGAARSGGRCQRHLLDADRRPAGRDPEAQPRRVLSNGAGERFDRAQQDPCGDWFHA
jgi:hypothetical protein